MIMIIFYDDKRFKTIDKIRTYPYRINYYKVCKREMLSKYKWLILIIILMKITQTKIQSSHIFQIIHTEH